MNNEIISKQENFINIFGENKQNAIILGNIEDAPTEEKIKFFNEVLDCQITVDKILNTPKEVKYIHIDKAVIKNENDSGTHDAARMVFYFMDGSACISFSSGVYTSIKKLVNVFGAPPYEFDIVFKEIQRSKLRVYSIGIIPKK